MAAPSVARPACPVDDDGVLVRTEAHMGTFATLRVRAPDRGAGCARVDDAMTRGFAEIARLEQLLSEWRPGTELSQINDAAGRAPVVVSPEVFDLVRRALAFAAATDGAFDPTFAALWGLWTFGDDDVRALPDAAEVERRRALIDWRKVVLNEDAHSVFLSEPGMKLGLGAIAKGEAVDRVATILAEAGAVDLVVQLGGETLVRGRLRGTPARAAIRDPRGEGAFAAFTWQGSIDTSGDYERFFMHHGVRFHHIIDPATGRPARRSRSATVLADDAMTADALATALFVLGPERGLPLIEALPGVEAIVVDIDNAVWLSSGVPDDLELVPPSDGP